MKNKAIIPLFLGLIVGGVAIKYGVDVVKRAQGSSAPAEQIDVVVASSDIPQAYLIEKEMVKTIKSPRSPLLTGERITKVDDVVGRVTAKSIPQGAPILGTMLAQKGAKPGINVKIPDGFRAVSVKVDEATSVAYQLKPGDWVDVLVVMDLKSTGKTAETISQVILQRVQVAAVGQVISDSPKDASKAVKSVTLVVPETDVPKVHLAGTKGKITLAMRGESDTRLGERMGAKESELTGTGKPDPTALTDPSLAMAIDPLAAAAAAAAANAKKQPAVSRKSEPKPEPASDPNAPPPQKPHMATVINSRPEIAGGTLQRVTFESASSIRVLSVGEGFSRGTAALLAPSAPAGDPAAARRGPGLDAYPFDSSRRDPVDESLPEFPDVDKEASE